MVLVDIQAIFETSAIECYNVAAFRALDEGHALPATIRAAFVTESTRQQAQWHETMHGTDDPCGKISVQDGDLLIARPAGPSALTIQVVPNGGNANLWVALPNENGDPALLPFTGENLYLLNHLLGRRAEKGEHLDANLVRFRRQATEMLEMVAAEPEYFEPSLAIAVLIEQLTGSFECIAWQGDCAGIVNKILADRIVADFPQQLKHVAAKVFPTSSLKDILGLAGLDRMDVGSLDSVEDEMHQRWIQVLPSLTSASEDKIAAVCLSGEDADRLRRVLSRNCLSGEWVTIIRNRISAEMANCGWDPQVSVQLHAVERSDVLMVRYMTKGGDSRALACAWPSEMRHACIELRSGEVKQVDVDEWIERLLAISPQEGLSVDALTETAERSDAALCMVVGESFLAAQET